MVNRPICCALSAALLLPVAAHADVRDIAPDIVVTPGRGAIPIEQVGSSVNVVTAEEINSHQWRTLPEALNAVPGLHVVQLGGRGRLTSVFTRGANSNQTLVLLNGQEIADPSAGNGGFNISHLDLDNVERIEVVRGPQSALYGSEAIGGVINIITKRGQGTPHYRLSGEIGSLGSYGLDGAISGSLGPVGYYGNLSRFATDGETVTAKRFRGGLDAEDDGYANSTGSLRLDADLGRGWTGSLFAQAIDTRADLDTAPEDLNAREETEQYFTSASLAGAFFDGTLKPKATLAYTDQERVDLDRPDANSATDGKVTNEGERLEASLEADIAFVSGSRLVLGGEYEREDFSSRGSTDFGGFVITQASDADTSELSVYGLNQFAFGERVSGTLGLRYDAPEDFDNKLTYSAALSYWLRESGTRIKGAYGTAFATPSLFERFGFAPTNFGTAFTGNPDLQPETSTGWEIGVEQSLLASRVNGGVTYFDNDIEDAVNTVFDASFNSTTVNNQDLETHGVEAFLEADVLETLTARADYTFTIIDSSVPTLGVRRPKHEAFLDLSWRPQSATTLTATLRHVRPEADIGFFGGIVRPGSYTVVNVAGAHAIGPYFEVFGRIENLTNQDYEQADGFRAPGIEAFTGLRLKL